jgi:hypothetical protein
LAFVLVVLAAGPALADPAGPTNYRSVVTSVDPRPTGVTIEVVGGDAFLSIALLEGHTLEVPGYFGEPYLRIDTDGTVWLNRLSPARWINRDRYGLSGVPDFADAGAEPDWEQVGDGGTFAWHDHRVHWMSFDLPPTVVGDRAQSVFPWTIEITIDGVVTEVSGELLWFPSANPAGPLLIGLIGILPLGRHRRRRPEASALTAAGVGAVALFVAVSQYAATPAFDRALPIDPVFPAFAVVAAVGALWLGARPIRQWSVVAIAGLALVWWAVKVGATLTAPVLASALPTALERLGVGIALWAGIGVIAVAGFELVAVIRGNGMITETQETTP